MLAASCPLDFAVVAGVTKPGLKGEWVIRTAHLVFHRVFVAHDLVSELPA